MSTTELAPRSKVTGYDSEVRFYATRYVQGGRTVYALDLSLAQIAGLLPAPDPLVPQLGNRRIQMPHAVSFGQYIRANEHWVSPAIVLRAADEFDFEIMESIEGTDFGIISLPFLALTEIHILDGQHRILGIHLAIRGIATELDKARAAITRLEKRKVPIEAEDNKLAQLAELKEMVATLLTQRARFERERSSVQIFIENDQVGTNQMFYDINDNVLHVTGSVSVRYDTRKAVNRALQDVLTHPLLEGRVDLEFDRLGRQNENLLSAKHVAEVVRIMAVGIDGRIGRRVEAELDESLLTERANQFFTVLTDSFSQLKDVAAGSENPISLRARSQVASPVMLRVLAGVFKELKNRNYSQNRIKKFFTELDPFLSQPATKSWVARTGDDIFFEGALSPSARRQDLVSLVQTLVSWAEKRPEWLQAA